MKRAIVVVMVVAATVCGTAASAQVGGSARLAWDACPGRPGALEPTPFIGDATSGETKTLYATYSVDDTIPGATSWDAILDFFLPAEPEVPPFWQFNAGSCNASGVQMSVQRPAPVACAGVVNQLCANSGACCTPSI